VIAWVVTGYFGLFDFGMSQAVTRSIAGLGLQPKIEALNGIKLASLVLHLLLGLTGGLLVLALTPLAISWFDVPPAMREEVEIAFCWMAGSVPAIVLASSCRGVLEGLHRFDLVNIVRIPANVTNYVGPLLAISLVPPRIDVIVAVIVIGRYLVLLAYWMIVRRLTERHFGSWSLARGHFRTLAHFGGWMSIVNFSQPSVVLFDRFLIGATVSLSAVSFYALPYEVVSKLWIFSSSILGVLFPLICSVGADDRPSLAAMKRQAVLALIAIVLPLSGIGLLFAPELLGFWVGHEVAGESVTVARILCLAMFVSVIAQVPFTILNGVGRADVTGKLLVLQFPVYALLAGALVTRAGIVGVATAWLVKVMVEAAVLFRLETRVIGGLGLSDRGLMRAVRVAMLWLMCFGIAGVLLDHHGATKYVVALFLVGFAVRWVAVDLLDKNVRADFRTWLIRSV
jgi:O-antigen/teichoic acid export membrane protein